MLPIFHTDLQELSLLQTQWASQVNPVLANPLLKGRIIAQVALQTGLNVVNHGLDRQPQGWFIGAPNANAQVWQPSPSNPLTLTLEASGPVTINLLVY